MSGQKFGIAGAAALVIGHCAGMLDLVALPVWVGAALGENFGFSALGVAAVLVAGASIGFFTRAKTA